MDIPVYNVMLNDDKRTVLVREKMAGFAATDKENMSSPDKVVTVMNGIFQCDRQAEEHVYVIALNTKCVPIGVFEVGHGNISGCYIGAREVFTRLCLVGAVYFVIVHNHPCGDCEPSADDKKTTQRFIECGELMACHLADHIIIGNGCYYSFREKSDLKFV